MIAKAYNLSKKHAIESDILDIVRMVFHINKLICYPSFRYLKMMAVMSKC